MKTPRDKLEERLQRPFPRGSIRWRAQSVSWDERKRVPRVRILAYLTARDVMNRLDEVLGPGGWSDRYEPTWETDDKGRKSILCVECRLSHTGYDDDDFMFYVSDVGMPSATEPIKGCWSDAFKRAAVKLGIGRYLYEIRTNTPKQIVEGYRSEPGWHPFKVKEANSWWSWQEPDEPEFDERGNIIIFRPEDLMKEDASSLLGSSRDEERVIPEQPAESTVSPEIWARLCRWAQDGTLKAKADETVEKLTASGVHDKEIRKFLDSVEMADRLNRKESNE